MIPKCCGSKPGVMISIPQRSKAVVTTDETGAFLQNGKITAVSEGKCKIYVIGVNGVRTSVNVTVK